MRRGSLAKRTIECCKPQCACAQDPQARHGRYYSLAHAIGGKARSRFHCRTSPRGLAADKRGPYRGRVDAL